MATLTTTMSHTVGDSGHELTPLPGTTSSSPADTNEEGATTATATTTPTPATHDKTLYRFLAAAFSFFVAGVNDGSIGALLPYVIRGHGVSTAAASTVYAANFAGWLLAALLNTHLAQVLDLGALMCLGGAMQGIGHALRVWDPPFPLFAVTFTLVGLGQAFNDTHANSFVAEAAASAAAAKEDGGGGGSPHRWLAMIHASYSAGCLVGPFMSTAIAGAAGPGADVWSYFYAVPLALCVANLGFLVSAFRDTVRIRSRQERSHDAAEEEHGPREDENVQSSSSRRGQANELMGLALRSPSLWYLGIFFFFYLGSVLTASGWIAEYLVDVRDGDISQMGYVTAGYNGGTLLGRLLLAEPIHRVGPRYMVFCLALLALGFQLVFWLVPSIVAASVAACLIGFFSGPFFATGVAAGTQLFDPKVKTTALAFIFVMAQVGGSAFPMITGGVASTAGVAVLQPILIALWGATALSWLMVPRPKEQENPPHQD